MSRNCSLMELYHHCDCSCFIVLFLKYQKTTHLLPRERTRTSLSALSSRRSKATVGTWGLRIAIGNKSSKDKRQPLLTVYGVKWLAKTDESFNFSGELCKLCWTWTKSYFQHLWTFHQKVLFFTQSGIYKLSPQQSHNT